jgi:hypothetical protein
VVSVKCTLLLLLLLLLQPQKLGLSFSTQRQNHQLPNLQQPQA